MGLMGKLHSRAQLVPLGFLPTAFKQERQGTSKKRKMLRGAHLLLRLREAPWCSLEDPQSPGE